MRKIKHPLFLLVLLIAAIVAVTQVAREVGGVWAAIIPPAFAMGMAGIIGGYLKKKPSPTRGSKEERGGQGG